MFFFRILKSSNAFVYFDTTSNTNSTSVINKLDISYLIYKSDINEQSFPQISETTNVILTLNIFDSDFKICKLQNQNINTTSINNAFAVFSSGSTGSPKIIRVPHDCIIPNIIDLRLVALIVLLIVTIINFCLIISFFLICFIEKFINYNRLILYTFQLQ